MDNTCHLLYVLYCAAFLKLLYLCDIFPTWEVIADDKKKKDYLNTTASATKKKKEKAVL